MEKVNVINGDGDLTNRIVNGLLPSALRFYGKEYEDIVIQAVKEIEFYELGKHENMDLVISVLTGCIPKNDSHNRDSGCFIYPKNPNSMSDYGDIIIYKNEFKRETYLTVAHELFGHGVCSRINRIIEEDNNLYNRNGIALHGIDNSLWINRIMNEGCVDFIAETIVNYHGMCVKTSDDYSAAKKTAKAIYNYLGREDFLKAMVLYDYDIEQGIDNLCGDGYFDRLSKLNEKRYSHEANGHYLRSYAVKKKVLKEIKKIA